MTFFSKTLKLVVATLLEGGDSATVFAFPLVTHKPNSGRAPKSEFMKDSVSSLVKSVANRYWMISA